MEEFKIVLMIAGGTILAFLCLPVVYLILELTMEFLTSLYNTIATPFVYVHNLAASKENKFKNRLLGLSILLGVWSSAISLGFFGYDSMSLLLAILSVFILFSLFSGLAHDENA
jgi:hypothetical protein